MRPPRGHQLLPLATDLMALVENPDDLEHGFDRLTRSYRMPAAEAARAALRADPAIAPLIAERYRGTWPGSETLLAPRPDSLGHRFLAWFAAAGGQRLPDPQLAADTAGDHAWLHQRVRHTHDLWPVVCGCPPTSAGEAVAYGLELARICAPLLAQRWEEGWHLPLQQWRERLGIAAFIAGRCPIGD